MRERQWGFTPAIPSSYPPYLNVTEREDGSFDVTARGPETAEGGMGDTAVINIARGDFAPFVRHVFTSIDTA